jgi:predicted DNA-binding antitoxin AbrB/MazE fold protein
MQFQGEISVTYRDGVLKPDQRLDVPNRTRFGTMIRPVASDESPKEQVKTIRQIRESGVFRAAGRKVTRDEMHERP